MIETSNDSDTPHDHAPDDGCPLAPGLRRYRHARIIPAHAIAKALSTDDNHVPARWVSDALRRSGRGFQFVKGGPWYTTWDELEKIPIFARAVERGVEDDGATVCRWCGREMA